MDILPTVFKACLLCLSLFSPSVFSDSPTSSSKVCPIHKGSDPAGVNARVKKFAKNEIYFAEDDDYRYKIEICKSGLDDRAVQQIRKENPDNKYKWVVIGQYKDAHVQGGTDWLMIKYLHGEKYHSHCQYAERIATVLVTCDPGVQTGSLKIIEEYRNSTKGSDQECYYLFELNHDAACSVSVKHLSPGSIMLIILIVLLSIYLLLGFLYQRFIAGAKGLEQIPNYDFWRDFGSLQADGCNFMCRCTEAHPTRYKTMDDALADDDRDDTLLPM